MKLWTDAGRTPEHGYTISSPCEPEGSGELKIVNLAMNSIFCAYTEMLTHRSTSIKQLNYIFKNVFPCNILYLFSIKTNEMTS